MHTTDREKDCGDYRRRTGREYRGATVTGTCAVIAIATGLMTAMPVTALAGAFPAEIDLLTLNGVNGFALDGASDGWGSGHGVSAAGDVNGDGFNDIIIGAPVAEYNGVRPGMSYVVFGTNQGFPAQSSLSALDGINGFAIAGVGNDDTAGHAVSGAGDVNGDGFDDIIIDAAKPETDPFGFGNISMSYVVFGAAGGFPAVFNLSTLDGTNGFALKGVNPGDGEWTTPANVSSAGDVNGDGFGDIVIGALWASSDPFPGPFFHAGRSYVVFGAASGFPAEIDLAALDGANGFTVNGIGATARSGTSVSAAGDVNADGFDDLVIGAPGASDDNLSPPGTGRAYVIFGTNLGFPAAFELSAIDGANGFALRGAETNDGAGYSVSTAGDVNGDGIGDIVIGAPEAGIDPTVISGRSYVVFGNSGGFPAQFELSSLDGTNGFTLISSKLGSGFGVSVSGAGDVNGDGIGDVVIGDVNIYDPTDVGQGHVVFGSDLGFPAVVEVSTLNGTNGFTVNGISENSWTGYSVSGAGDINGDGADDVIVGAPWGLSAEGFPTGQTYVVFGRPAPPALAVSGVCPGKVTINYSAGTPNGAVSLYAALLEGTFVIPAGSCAGAVLGLDSPYHIVTGLADADGAAEIVVRLPRPACGRFLQAIDETTCTPSNVVQLP